MFAAAELHYNGLWTIFLFLHYPKWMMMEDGSPSRSSFKTSQDALQITSLVNAILRRNWKEIMLHNKLQWGDATLMNCGRIIAHHASHHVRTGQDEEITKTKCMHASVQSATAPVNVSKAFCASHDCTFVLQCNGEIIILKVQWGANWELTVFNKKMTPTQHSSSSWFNYTRESSFFLLALFARAAFFWRDASSSCLFPSHGVVQCSARLARYSSRK